ncbi:hypothetical protein VST7929_01980 [Vibrio stylophorae]|uniref:Heme exporter protein D n=1 Tax=Vibrio stylophorae TaxID=659351 RepID=A0ABM8ZUT1_9VIBR|nr:heme exporter protein CcmD [Vibrio stylophorae]CAH0534079.1 hypothetical protein VST7929_01980 [Vibrio stylophorae]
MQFLIERLDFGAYAGFIWGVYGISFVMLLWLVMSSYRHHRQICQMILTKQRREQRIQAAKDASKESSL